MLHPFTRFYPHPQVMLIIMIPDRSHDPELVSWSHCNSVNTTIATSSNVPAAVNASKHARHDSVVGNSAAHLVTSSEEAPIVDSEEADPPLVEPVISGHRILCSLRGGATISEITKKPGNTDR